MIQTPRPDQQIRVRVRFISTDSFFFCGLAENKIFSADDLAMLSVLIQKFLRVLRKIFVLFHFNSE